MSAPTETIEIHGPAPQGLKFPAPYKHNEKGYIVLFKTRTIGMEVHSTDCVTSEDFVHGSWAPCSNPDVWTPVHLVINNPNA